MIAPVVFLPGDHEADRGFTQYTPHVFDNNVISLRAIFIENIATLSAFNSIEADRKYLKNCTNASSIRNAYGTIDGLKEAFWKIIVADTDGSLLENALSMD